MVMFLRLCFIIGPLIYQHFESEINEQITLRKKCILLEISLKMEPWDWHFDLEQPCVFVLWIYFGYENKSALPGCGRPRLDCHITGLIPNLEMNVPMSWTHWDRDKMAAIFQTTFSHGFSWMKMYEFRWTFHWSLFPGVQLTIFQHWFR